MLINNNGINGNNLSSSQVKGSAEGSENTSNTAASSEGDSVNLSADAHSLSRLETALITASDINTNRIDAIREALDAGTYHIDAEAIATKLLDSDSLS